MKKRNILVFFILALMLLFAVMITGCDNPKETKTTPTAETTETPTAAPTVAPGPLSGLKICIDPGHQLFGNNDKEALAPWDSTMKTKTAGGTVSVSGVAESVVNLSLSNKIRDVLVSLGAEVIMTRTVQEVDLSNYDRALIANNANVDLVIRVHHNGSDNKTVNGMEIYTRGKGDGTAEYQQRSVAEQKMGTEMLKYITEITGAVNRGSKTSDIYTGINWTTAPCFIIEAGFLTNPEEESKLITDEYQNLIAQGIANWLLATDSI